MGEYVVHLARHLRAFESACFGDAATLLGLGAAGTFAQ
jgi:hypothetical protein